MAEYFITLSALIAVVLLVRVLFRKNISPTVMYALWLVVVLRLCLPFSFFTLAVLPPESDTPVFESEAEQTPDDTTPVTDAPETHPDLPGIPVVPGTTMVPVTPPVPVTPSEPVTPIDPITQPDPITPIEPTPDTNPTEPIAPDVPDVPSAVPFNLKKLAVTVWIAGACILAVWFAVTGTVFHIRLCKRRTLYKKVNHTRVYLTEDASAPCLAGIIPSIYIRPETPKTGDAHAFIVLHEYMHLRHGDHVWSLVRMLALIAHWWNPLVWAAAIVSKQDAELACDHAVAAKLKSEDRFAYARILLDTIPQKHRYAVGLGSSPMKERIVALTKKQKNRILCVVLAAVLAIGAVVGSFIALTEKPPQGDETTTEDETTNDIPFTDAAAICYALEFATYFRDPVSDVSALKEHENLWQFLVNALYDMHQKNSLTLYDITEKEWQPQYLIPQLYFLKAAEVLLGLTDVPERIFALSDFGYDPILDAFVYSPFSGPMFTAKNMRAVQNEDGTFSVTIRISRIEESAAIAQNVYTFRTVEDPEWGTVYQLVSIENALDENTSALGDYLKLAVAPSGGMEVEDMPLSQYARLTAHPVGYNPMVYVYDDNMTFYMVYSAPGKITQYMSVLRLPDGYVDGYIAYAEGGAGSGELFLYVTAAKDGKEVLLAYFFLCDGSQPQPTEVIILTGEWEERIREILTKRPTDAEIRDLWRSIDGQRNPYGLTYGTIPNSFNPIEGTFTSADYYADGGARLNEVLSAYDEDVHQMPVLAYIVREMNIPRADLIAYLEASEILYTDKIVDELLTADLGTLNKSFLNPMAEYHDGVIYTTKVFYEMDQAGEEIPLPLQIVQHMAQNAKEYGERSATSLPDEYAEMYTRVLTKMLAELPKSDVQSIFDMYTTEFSIYPRVMTLFVGTDRFNEWLENTPLLTLDEGYNIIPRSIVTMLKDFGITKEEFELLTYIGYYGELYDVEVMYEGTAEEIDNYFRSIPRWQELCNERNDLIFVKGLLLDAMPGYTNDVALRDKYNSLPLTCWTFSDLAIDGIYTKDEMKTLIEKAVLYDTVGLQMTNRYDVDAIFAEAERNPVSVSGHWSISDDATREEILAYGAHCKEVIEKERTFYTPWYDLPRYEEDKGAVSVDYAGPFVGYVEDAYTPWIELYTEKDGLYVGRIPYKIFDGWPATERDRESWRPGWQPEYVHFYLDRFGSFVWAGVHLTDTVLGSGRKNIATSPDYGASWEVRPYYEMDFGGNHVTGMGFASETVAFMSFDPQFEPVGTAAISRTTDGGKTWERMPIEVPEIISTNRLTPLVPRFDGLTGEYPILVQHAQNPERILYLVTEDGGMTWVWDETRPLSTYRLPYTGTWEAHYTVAATYDYDVSEMVAHCYYDPHAGNYVTEFYASSNKEVTVVLGVQNDRQPYGSFTDFKTYRVVTKANYVDSVTELPTITKELVYKEGKPFTGTLSGIYQSKLHDKQGLMSRRVIIEGDTISVKVGFDSTATNGLYDGTYTYDKTTGTFTAAVKHLGDPNPEIETVSGKLYEYGGYVHFLCEESTLETMPTDLLLPVTFRKEGAPLPDNSDMIGENQAGDWYSTYTDDYGNLQYVYRLTFEPETKGITFSSDYHFGEYGHVYEGTYTVDANYFVHAVLREGMEEITMKFSFGYYQSAAPSGGWIKTLGISLYECSADRYKDLIGVQLIFQEELNGGVKSYTVDLPISDNGREYIACAAAYGDSFGGTAPYAGEIRAGADGTMYYVLGIGDSYRSSGYFKTYKTYCATSAGGYLTSVEETETFTKDAILKNGTPYKGTFFGEHTAYAAKAQSGHYGTVLRTYVLNLEENGKISLSSTVVGTGPAIRYEGMYTYDKGTGLFAASLTGRYSNEGETTEYPVADVRGKLYEYGGFVHFVCEESGIHILSPEDPFPLTFVKPTASKYRTAIWHTVPVYGGGDVTLRIPKEWEWNDDYFDEMNVRDGAYPNMKRVGVAYRMISLAQFEEGLRNPEGPSFEYVMDSPITGTTDYGYSYTGYYGGGYADGDHELTRRYLFYIDTGDDAYVLEIWQRLEYDGDSTAFLSEVVLPIVRSFCEADRAANV